MTIKASRGGGGRSKHRHLWAVGGPTALTLKGRGDVGGASLPTELLSGVFDHTMSHRTEFN